MIKYHLTVKISSIKTKVTPLSGKIGGIFTIFNPMNYIVATYLVRLVGILLLIPAIFPPLFIGWFPGLEDRRASWVLFAVGITIYAGAAIAYRILYKREQERRRKEDI